MKFLLTAGSIALALATSDAHAEEPGPPAADAGNSAAASSAAASSAEDDRLRRFLDVEASDGRSALIRGIAVDAVIAAVTIPLGVVLATKDDPGIEIAGITLLVRGSYDLVAIPFVLGPTPMERLRNHHEERTARGEPAAERVAETEREWQQSMVDQRRAAGFNAALGLSVGAAEAAAGMYLLLQEPGVLGLDRREQTVSGALVTLVPLRSGAAGAFTFAF